MYIYYIYVHVYIIYIQVHVCTANKAAVLTKSHLYNDICMFNSKYTTDTCTSSRQIDIDHKHDHCN